MKKYLILAAADISKAQQSTNASSSSQHRNITIDSDEASSTSTYSYNNHSGSTTRNGSLKFILKEIFPIESDELITAFEFDGRVVKQSNTDPSTLVGKVLQVNTLNLDTCRGILLLKCDECQIVGMPMDLGVNGPAGMDDLFDDDELLNLSFI